MRNLGKICFLFFVVLLVLSGCSDDDSSEIFDGYDHARTFLFAVRGYGSEEYFSARTSNSDLLKIIDQQLSLPESERLLHIGGTIDYCSGGCNLDWSWRFVDDDWALVEMSIELCDGIPSYVEQDLDYWIGTVGCFCPWSSYVLEEIK